MKKEKFLLFVWLVAGSVLVQAQTFRFDFSTGKKTEKGFTKVTSESVYSDEKGYGYDLQPAWDGKGNAPFFFSVEVPDGNYRVTVTLGSRKSAGMTTVRGESRRLFLENIPTRKGELRTESFTVNKRNTLIAGDRRVKIKPRERKKLNWDDKLTLEFNGDAPRLHSLVIERVDDVPTVFLCGNSTVVDNDNEPWASWGQMIPRFFTDKVCIANYAESGLAANTFIAGFRLEKLLTQLKAGDYVLVEFGHNDQKQRGPGIGAYYSFSYYIKQFIDEARSRGAYPVLITPTRRRQFSADGHILDTHEDYPAAIRDIAAREHLPLIDLQEMTKVLCETLGEENSRHLYVHYPANTYPGQTGELKDNTHFNAFGAYEVAKCVIEGMKKAGLSLVQYLRSDYKSFDPPILTASRHSSGASPRSRRLKSPTETEPVSPSPFCGEGAPVPVRVSPTDGSCFPSLTKCQMKPSTVPFFAPKYSFVSKTGLLKRFAKYTLSALPLFRLTDGRNKVCGISF